jgi:hypothetical protein
MRETSSDPVLSHWPQRSAKVRRNISQRIVSGDEICGASTAMKPPESWKATFLAIRPEALQIYR